MKNCLSSCCSSDSVSIADALPLLCRRCTVGGKAVFSSERVVIIVGGGGCRRRGGDGGGGGWYCGGGGGGGGWKCGGGGGGGGGGVSWNIASVGTMSEGGSCWIFSRMSGGRIVAMYEESSGRLGTLD